MLQRAEQPVALAGVEASRRLFAPCFHPYAGDRLWVAHVDGQARCIHLASYEGVDGSEGLPIRAIIGDAIRLDSAGIVLAQQDAAAGSEPSGASRAATRALALAAEAVDLAFLDHLVFAGSRCTSFRRLGLI
jgi:DNA repair protein RadC